MAATGRGELRGRGEERERNSKRRLECSPLGQVREAPSKQSRTDRDFVPRASQYDAPGASSSSSAASSSTSTLVRAVRCTLDLEASGHLFKPATSCPSSPTSFCRALPLSPSSSAGSIDRYAQSHSATHPLMLLSQTCRTPSQPKYRFGRTPSRLGSCRQPSGTTMTVCIPLASRSLY